MKIELTPQQKSDRAAMRAFVDQEIAPFANQYDQEERIPLDLIRKLAQRGYWGAVVPRESGGRGLDMITWGILNEELGRGCSSVRSLLTVHSMVARALWKWGARSQREYWLPRIASGEVLAAFSVSEPNVGSDAKSVETKATLSGEDYLLEGHKKWITGGQIANLFLIIAQCGGKPSAFLVERDCPGLTITPIYGMLGVRASMLAEIRMNSCRIPKENLVGKIGFGFSHVASSALDYGRYSVAWGCVGIGQACLEASLQYTRERRQFNAQLKDYQLIQQLITEMIAGVKAARLLCLQAGYLKDIRDPGAILETSIAKYFASTMAMKVACDAVQIHGANGCSSAYPVQRYMRDAKIMEIIEGSTQLQQIAIAQSACQASDSWSLATLE